MEPKQSIAPELVKEFVGNAHGDLNRVRELLEQEPGLLNAAWDWGGGDWETALGAAAHMGRRDIALFLLERGARLDLFAAAMLGKLEVVKAMIADNSSLKDAPGPHGIPLVAHAQAGGEEASAVIAFLQ
ncbi:ankyrin repeat domain-containing protein [Paenibacillus glycinis]|uniref:Ankyrin repeat domain-containing protein n=1 Tax=Paenibacillus glycinis TaxID=2697035 RepID=A0ABW9XWK6_9BACL|nr:ankyrin repeat domain-containing protein [Paenibacillus glycinis]NBD27075.1 ankyrin repeat domain-containing protein [Paenibacillus glycinis]